MTAMDSDSESQDSDDGRRFRFEATRKDSVAPVDTTDRTKTPKKKHKSSYNESYRDRKERSKHESGSKTDDKDLRHSAKHSKHESRNSRQEDSKNSHKDHRESRSGFATNDRGSRNSNGGDGRERLRDSKRQSDKDRSVHRGQRSREHSYERNHHDERATSDKHRGRYHERHKHRSRDRSRDRSHQSSRIKSSNDDHRSREDHGRHDSSKKISVKENRSQNSRDYSSPKNTAERERSHSETRSDENTKKDSSIEAQDCKDLDLSQFDVLSETDENMSDDRDSESRTSSPHSRKIKLKRHDSEIRSESRATKRENDDGVSEKKRREELKVKGGSCDPASSSSNNYPSAVSDSLLGSASHATLLVTRMDSEREKSEYREEERMLYDSNVERSSSGEKYSRFSASSDETRLLEKDTDQTGSTYGPLLPPSFVSNTSGDELDFETSNIGESKINDEVDGKNMNFIGPCLLPRLKDRPRSDDGQDDTADASATEVDTVFGPVLPPHLLQRQREKKSRDRIIGPVLPDTLESREEGLTAFPESDDDSAIGPLPVDHPALRTSRVHEQLDLRAQRIRDEKCSEEIDFGNKREEWMTELPPAQAANLGLGPRKFRLRDGPDMSDRSCWTDTPVQKAQKQMDLETKRFRESEKKLRESEKKHVNEFQKKEADKSGKREKSLLEMHQSKVAKKKKKEEKEARRAGISTRRPFDRDIDLQVNRFDQAQKKSILMKSQLLDDRFSRGQI